MTATLGFWSTAAGGPPPPPPPPGGALDSYTTNLWGVWSIKQEVSAYTGPLVRVRRASDNAEMDVYSVSGGLTLDSAAMLAWSGAGVSVFVKTIYDQSGSARDATQATAGNQAMIVSSGTYLGFIQHDGSDDYYTTASNPQNGTLTMFSRLVLASVAARQMLMLIDNGTDGSDSTHGAWLFDFVASSGSGPGYRNAILSSGGSNIIVQQTSSGSGIASGENVIADVMNFPGAADIDRVPIYTNGSVVGPAIATAGTVGTGVVLDASSIYIGASIGAANPSTAQWKKFVLYNTALGATPVAAISAVL